MTHATLSKKRSRSNLIYEDVPRWNTAAKIARVPWILIGVWLLVRAALWLLSGHVASGILYMFLVAAYCACLLFFIAPRKYQILDDRLKVLFGGPFSYSFPLSRIQAVRPHSVWGLEYVISFSVLLCTSGETVEVLHSAGSFLVSPADRDTFVTKSNESSEKAKSENRT